MTKTVENIGVEKDEKRREVVLETLREICYSSVYKSLGSGLHSLCFSTFSKTTDFTSESVLGYIFF